MDPTGEDGADGGKDPTSSKGTSPKPSAKKSRPASKKKATAGPSKAPAKKKEGSVKKTPRPMGKRKQQQVTQAYQKLLKSRNIFGRNRPGEGASEDPSPDTEGIANLQDFIDRRPEVEGDLVKEEQRTVDRAWKRCAAWVDPKSPVNGQYVLRDIKTHLTPIQFSTLGWMLGKEAPNSSIRGGIVGHDMGLGKTLMAIALMVTTKIGLDRMKANNCPTLVVVPSYAIIDHWEEEIMYHAPGVFSRDSLGRYSKLKGAKTVEWFKPFKVVFATYGELSREIPGWYKEPRSPNNSLGPEMEEKIKKHAWHPVYLAVWYRVILDEAHTIKNRVTKASLAVRRLQKKHGWAISGTPLSNGRDEMFPYFNFIGMDESTYPSTFLEKYFPEKVATPEFQEVMTRLMTRRRIGETFLGQQIIALPSHHSSTEILKPTAQDIVVMKFIQAKIKEKAEKTIKKSIDAHEDESTAISKAMNSITSLLHLYRFAGIHPFLMEKAFMREFSVKDNELLIQELELVEDSNKANDPDFLSIAKIMKIGMQHRKLDKVKCCGCRKRVMDKDVEIRELPCGHFGCFPCLVGKLKNLRLTCRAKDCSQECHWDDVKFYPTLYKPKSQDDVDASGSGSDSDGDGSEAEEDHREGKRGPTKASKKPEPGIGSDLHQHEPQLEPDKQRFLACMDECMKKTKMVVPSAKILRLQELLNLWKRTAPDDKIIVFTQFHVVAKLVGRVARLEGMKFLYYTGDLSEGARKKALDAFKNDDSAKIMITSFKAGGQALNITRANRVILMELWWNSPAEEQAFARVYRMGQKKEVHVVRLTVEGTREDEILEMQDMKDKELQDCLMSRKMTKSNHSVHSILSLLGIPVPGENGKITSLKKRADSSEESEGEEDHREGREKAQDDEEHRDRGKLGDRADSKAKIEVDEGGDEVEETGGEAKDGKGNDMEGDEGGADAGKEVRKEKDGDADRENVKGAGHSSQDRDNVKGAEGTIEDKVIVSPMESDDGDKENSDEAKNKNGVEEKGKDAGSGKRLGLGQERHEDSDVEMGDA